VSGHKDGFGFLIPEDGSDDLLITSREMRRVFHGDTVQARVAGYDHRGRREAQIVRIAERNMRTLVGRYYEEDGQGYVSPDNPHVTQDLLVVPSELMPTAGQFVTADIVEYPTLRTLATARIVEVLGDHLAPGMEIEVAIRNFEIPHVWPDAVEKEAAAIPPQVLEKDKEGRFDLRDLPLVTIDGEDARDFDDAVYCEKRRGGYRLIVAIADVSHYVRAGSALDTEAIKRGNSVYFPQHVVPMLPEVLSNGLCSLNPHVDRLCLVCDMNISSAGRVTAYKFHEAVMHSKARLTYTKVSALLEHPESEEGKAVAQEYSDLVSPLQKLYELFGILRVNREKRGALDFESNETKIIFNKERKIEKIVPVTRNQAHMLIEECMLAANVCAADFVMSNELPALYRNHEGPRDEKLSKLRNYLGILGIQFTAGKKPQPADFQKVLGQIEGRPDAHIVQAMLLRSLTQAVYAPDNVGHFGLAYEAYAHFTSPIRRYPDLLLHRAIRHKLQSLAGVKKTKGDSLPDKGQMVAYGEHCSMTERRADEATRDVVAWLKCEYMQSRVGEEFEGVISGVTTFGFFVELTDIYVEGLVHVSHLKSDYYEYDSISQRLIGSRSGIRFSLGDAVRIKVAGVDLDNRKMDFELVHKTGAFNESSGKESFGKESSEKENKLKKGDAKKSPVKKESSVRDRLKKGEVPPMGVAKEHVVGKQKGGVTKPSKTKPKKSAKPKAAKGSAKKAVKKK
jgi:ribonuclease R